MYLFFSGMYTKHHANFCLPLPRNKIWRKKTRHSIVFFFFSLFVFHFSFFRSVVLCTVHAKSFSGSFFRSMFFAFAVLNFVYISKKRYNAPSSSAFWFVKTLSPASAFYVHLSGIFSLILTLISLAFAFAFAFANNAQNYKGR